MLWTCVIYQNDQQSFLIPKIITRRMHGIAGRAVASGWIVYLFIRVRARDEDVSGSSGA